MALILLAFVGTLAIFFRIWRELDSVRRALDDVRKSLQYYAVDAAQQNRDLAVLIREQRSGDRQETDAGDDCLGELLERGIPNLSASPSDDFSPADPDPASSGGSSLPDIASGTGMLDDEEEDFFRRFEKGPGKGFAS